MNQKPPFSLVRLLELNRTVGVVLVAVLCFGLGEQLWRPFVPVLLDAQTKQLVGETASDLSFRVGQPTRNDKSKSASNSNLLWQTLWRVGLFACVLNLFEGFCYIGGGQVTAWLGDRGSLMLFAVLTLLGYALFLGVSAPWSALLASLLILGWEPLSVPVTFTTVGATVGDEGRGMAFALQSIQKRLPKIVGPVLAGVVLEAAETRGPSPEEGRIAGMHLLVGLAFVLGLLSLAIQARWMPPQPSAPPLRKEGIAAIVRAFPTMLRRLLLAEILTRWCDWLVREFVVLYLVLIRGVSLREVGALLSLQNVVALLTYLPIGRLTRTVGLQPFIGLTFVFFALFPLVLSLTPDGGWLVLPFVVYGLREIGEPARKALITALLPEPVRARGIGLYWGLRSFAICSASLAGACLWYAAGPEVLLHVAFALGCAGAGVFYFLCRNRVEDLGRV